MCIPGLDPITLAGIALSGAGAAVNRDMQNDYIAETNNQNDIVQAREARATEEERARQLAFERSQAAEVTDALMRADPSRNAEVVAKNAATSEISAIPDDYTAPTLQGQVGDSPSAETIGKIVAGSTDRLRKVLGGAAILSEQDTGMRGIGDELMRMSSDVQSIGSARQGSLNASSKERSIPAAEVTASASPLGDLVMLAGQALAGKSASGALGKKVAAKAPGDVFTSKLKVSQ